MRLFDGIIFDVDGTLAETHELIFASFNHVAEKYLNKRLTNEEIVALFGPTEDVILKEWMKGDYEKARKDYFDFYESNHSEMADIFPGMNEVIGYIKEKAIPLGIFTGKGRDSATITLKSIGLYDHFDLILSGDDVEEHKPAPEGIIKFVEKYSLDPGRVLMIGDAIHDVMASESAGVKCALVLWDEYSRNRCRECNPDYKFYNVDEFVDFIKCSIP
ncbi:MAG TPA: HAD family hydrolase [Melioribacteraceae bacterium]|nr:HAD family hydrolase [Melioribacteraceae bacterium]